MTEITDTVSPYELPRAERMQNIVVAFDVDGTLIKNEANNKDAPIHRQIDLLKTLSTFKNIRIVVWSGGGRAYAELWGDRLDINKYVWRYASKLQAKDIRSTCDVLIAIDDIQATEIGDINLIVREK